jgi:hypothetical protein
MKARNCIFTMVCAMLLASVFMSFNENKDEDGSTSEIDKSHLAYNFTRDVLQRYSDIFAFTYALNQYSQQTTQQGRDSVKALYMKNDVITTEPELRLVTNGEDINAKYDIKISKCGSDSTDKASNDSWIVSAESDANGEALVYHFVINNLCGTQWVVVKSQCQPKILSNNSFVCNNKLMNVSWNKNKASLLSFDVSGSGSIKSNGNRNLKFDYDITQPIQVLSIPMENNIKKPFYHSLLYDTEQYKNNFTSWQQTRLNITVNDKNETSAKYITAELKSYKGTPTVRILTDGQLQDWDDSW